MANTYIQIYLHIVFAVKNRDALISKYQEGQIHSYMASVINNLGHKAIIIGGTDDHVHMLISFNPVGMLPDLIKELKTSTTKFINSHRLCPFKFEWQRGYACFSYSHSLVDKVFRYIQNQRAHHTSESLADEMRKMLDGFGMSYDSKYLFESPA